MSLQPDAVLRYSLLSSQAYPPVRVSLGKERGGGWGSTFCSYISSLQATSGSVGFDLRSAYEYIVPMGGRALVMTDLQICLPQHCYGRLAARSGLCIKQGICVGAGVLDPDYRGNVGVVLFNHSNEDYYISHGDRVAQLVCERVLIPDPVRVNPMPYYTSNTSRGAGSFGHTGL